MGGLQRGQVMMKVSNAIAAVEEALTRPQPSPKVDGLVERAREAWDRILNMDGGQPQTIAAGLWATIYADALIHIAEQVQP
jgi:hypothetical protein